MQYLACNNPREDFLITSEDMVGKAGVWAHWGSWSFTKKYTYDNYQSLSSEQIAENIDENISTINQYVKELKDIQVQSEIQNIKKNDLVNRWFADYPSYIPIQNQYKFSCQNNNNTLICQNGVTINMLTGDVTSQFGDNVKFNNMFYPTADKQLVKKSVGNGNIDLLLIPSQTGFSLMMMQSPLGASQFTKMFYLNGFGQYYLKAFDSKQSVTGIKIKVFKAVWNATENKVAKAIKVNQVQFNTTKDNVNKIINDSNISLNSSNVSNSSN
jgi:hypothetical protein